MPCRTAVRAPSGISISFNILALQPISYRSDILGSSLWTSTWVAVPMTRVVLFMARISFTDLSLPMVTGSIVPGNSTESLIASIGSVCGTSILSVLALASILITGSMLISPPSIGLSSFSSINFINLLSLSNLSCNVKLSVNTPSPCLSKVSDAVADSSLRI